MIVNDLLALGTATAALGLAVLTRADRGEPNTYGLPEGEPIAAELRRWFRLQEAAVLAAIPETGPLPERFPDLAGDDWTDPMATAMTPMIGGYWDSSGKEVYSRLGLDPGDWKVTNPHLRAQIEKQSFSFCDSTNATTSKRLGRALEELKAAFVAGLVEEGETLPQLTKRVKGVFEGLSTSKARTIAATEASRAVHAAQLTADHDSQVVAGLELLLSADACPLCRKVATECKRVRIGQAFAIIGSHPEYSTIKHPPIHVSCQCTIIEVLLPEYGGPPHVEWGHTLIQPQKDLKDGYTPPEGKKEPEPEPKKAAKPPRPTKPPPPRPAPPPVPEPNPVPIPPPAPVPAPAPPAPPVPAKPRTPIDRAVEYARARGIDVEPNAAGLLTRIFKRKADLIPAAYDSGSKKIEINERQSYWADPGPWIARQHASGWFSSGHEGHIIAHEVGHALHDRADPVRYREVRELRFTAAQKRLVTAQVSRYGATQPIEMVAETYAGLVAGKRYNDEVMALYASFNGPMP